MQKPLLGVPPSRPDCKLKGSRDGCQARGFGTASSNPAGVGRCDGTEAAAAGMSAPRVRLSRTLIYGDEAKMPLDAKSCSKRVTEP